ncbi:MAG: glycosyltransferase [Oscillatoria sp. PMC 1051.18]|nr:glycosyltransferase [Oscillatoria sp. PMC 1050.18]MEC5032074.1 glycosyltransferase [Oscillatoria sp. PMC 1051.18]
MFNSNSFFSVIIPTCNRNDLLAKCLDCLAPGIQTLPIEKYEVIVTDDGLETTAEEMLLKCYPWVKWVAGSQLGPAANRNNGAKYARGEWLVFTDDDCLPDRHWLEAYTKAITTIPEYQVFEGRVYVDRPRRYLAETSPVNESGGYLWSCNFTIKRELFQSLGGFDERFPYATMEDVEFRVRLTKQGYKFAFVKEASVCHPWRFKKGWYQLKQHQESTLLYLSIHPEQLDEVNSFYYLKHFWRVFQFNLLSAIEFGEFKFYYLVIEPCFYLRMSSLIFVKHHGHQLLRHIMSLPQK